MKWIVAIVLIWAAWKWLRPAPRQRTPRVDARAEARALLGVGVGASEEEIRGAHRRLVAAAHPDRGGSAEDTRRINAARDVLLDRG